MLPGDVIDESAAPVLDVHGDEEERHELWICRFPPDERGGWGAHYHRQHQIVWVALGAATVQVEQRQWVIPPTQALWIPGGLTHDVWCRPGSVLYCLYVWPTICPLGWPDPTVVSVSVLLRELLLCLADEKPATTVSTAARQILFELLRPVDVPGLAVPLPSDERAADLARAILDCPSDTSTLREWGRRLGTSESTLRRGFVTGTGVTFSEWRTQARLRASLPLLQARVPVGVVARRIGYASINGFVDAFRRHFGQTPGVYAQRILAGEADAGAQERGASLPAREVHIPG